MKTGIMWEFDHLRVLEWEEYQYYCRHPLPFGWTIIVEPESPDE